MTSLCHELIYLISCSLSSYLLFCGVCRQEGSESRVATVVIRGSTENLMDDIERAIDDGVNTFKGICRVS